jgi:hypothetical protein
MEIPDTHTTTIDPMETRQMAGSKEAVLAPSSS